MTRLKLLATMVCALGVFGLPAGASAQNLPLGKSVQVTGLDGSRRSGSLVSLDGKTVVIEQRAGTATIPLEEVRTVTRPSYAILAGTFTGFGVGFMSGLVVCGNQSDCPPLMAGLLYGAVGAGIGAGVGFAIKSVRRDSRVVYRAPAKTKTMALTPVVGRRLAGVQGVISW